MKLDEFESRFNRADKTVFEYKEIKYQRVLLITDMPKSQADDLQNKLQLALKGLEEDAVWEQVIDGQFDNAQALIEIIDAFKPDLIVTYRNLRHRNKQQDYTLGIYVDVLTQATLMPVLIIPYPDNEDFEESLSRISNVLIVSDHVQGDYHLIDSALPFTGGAGTLRLTHIEDKQVYDRYMGEIDKIPEIPTTDAKEAILNMLLKEPEDYIKSCEEVLEAQIPGLDLQYHITLGHCLEETKSQVAEHNIGLVVANTKDDNQLAMHGDAYAIAVELKKVPLLLL
ncbi:MAG: hypothetical protein P1V97_32745 [Planctomycetota bacterium]|nr:hypothetical protein [Planctomycetota bacterium]